MASTNFEHVNVPLLQHHDSNSSLEYDQDIDEKDIEPGLTGVNDANFKTPQRSYLPLFSLLFNVVIFAFWLTQALRTTNQVIWRGTQPIYSPAEDSIKHVHIRFMNLTERSKYHGPPSVAVDKEWEDLYIHSITALSEDEASKLANETVRSTENDEHIVQLDAFHLLHCLNTVRKYLWPDDYPLVVQQRYKNVSGVPFDHIDHCINNIRNFLTCSADVTPNRFKDHKGLPVVQFDTVHSCTDFDALREWARKHRSALEFTDLHNSHGGLAVGGGLTWTSDSNITEHDDLSPEAMGHVHNHVHAN